MSSKREWLNEIRMILIDNLSEFNQFVGSLGTNEFNAGTKWKQLNDKSIETLFFDFMDAWYEQTPHPPNREQIISALQNMHRNDIINTIQNDVKLREQLSTDCPCEGATSSKPTWLNTIRNILIKNLGKLDEFVAYLGTSEFNATAKWEQLNQNKNQTQISKFMDVWYEQTTHRNLGLNHIISALKAIPRNDIIKTIQENGILREQLIKEGIRNEEYGARKAPTQVTSDDGYISHENKYDLN